MSHSHIPVKHLLKQVELYRAKRNSRNVRPGWATVLIDRAAELFEPLEGVGRVGYDCQLADDRWQVGMFLGATEIVGGPSDGKSQHANFQLDLSKLVGMFSEIEGLTWQALPNRGEVGQTSPMSSVTIVGVYEGNPVRLQVFSIPPQEAGPGFRAYPERAVQDRMTGGTNPGSGRALPVPDSGCPSRREVDVKEPIRWGILATGFIARQFAQALNVLDDGQLLAVGSRTRESAERFGAAYNVPRCHASYEALAADPDVDIVYVATPHALHKENSILCLSAGKAVLCEKPFTINRGQAGEVIAVAGANRRFLMEAMWTRFIPAVQQALRWIAEGAIGEVRMVQASFGYRDDSPTIFDPHLGGGSLLDVGIYPITLAHLAFNKAPNRIESLPTLGRNGVDEQAGILLGFEGGGLAILSSAIQTQTPYEGYILGTEGRITLHGSFWNATRVSLIRGTTEPEIRDFPHLANGYEYEAREAQACLRAGRLESDIMPHRTTLEIIDILDRIRAQWGLRYPMER